MTVKVLIVDDSAFFRRRVEEILDADKHIEVVGTASDGIEAIKKAELLKPDVITMDIEMPVMDGISAVRKIMEKSPTAILMLSSMTTEGAQITLEALEAGALDFIPKKMDDISIDSDAAKRTLCARVRLLGARNMNGLQIAKAPSAAYITNKNIKEAQWSKQDKTDGNARGREIQDYKLLIIGASTGGPIALQKVLSELPSDFPLPILLAQHMPKNFTSAFAQRLNDVCDIDITEARDRVVVESGKAVLAPGGSQMQVERARDGKAIVRIRDAQPGETYKPCIDITFSSAAEAYSDGVLVIVLTGMGSDGREGARLLKDKGSTVWAQDQESSVIFGMPMAVIEAGLADEVLPLSKIGQRLAKGV